MSGPEAPNSRRAHERVAAIAVFAITAPLYLATMNRTIGFIDRGELAAVATTLGIAHPTGYPTLTLLGFLATRLVLVRPVLVLNGLAALLVAAGAAVTVLLFARILREAEPEARDAAIDSEARTPVAPPTWARAACAGLAALLCAVTQNAWQQANGFEAYALHALFLPLVLLLYLRFVERMRARIAAYGIAEPDRSGPAFALLLGLSFTNHMTTILLVPAMLAHYFATFGLRRPAFMRLLRLVPVFVLGLTPYAWLPLQAATGPRFNWGDPDVPARFFAHLSGRAYQGWMFSFGESSRQQLAYFVERLPGEFAWVGLGLVVAGAVLLVRRRPALWILSVLLLAASVTYAAGYRIRDIDPYFMPAMMALGICFLIGLDALFRRARPLIASGLAAALVISCVALHYRACDESGNTLVEDLTRNQLDALPPRAVLFTSQWDYGLSASYYFQTVEGLRPDVLVVNLGLAHLPWYWDELERRDPEAARRMRPAFDRYRTEAGVAGECEACGPSLDRAVRTRLLDRMADPRLLGRPVFLTLEVDRSVGGELRRVPTGLAWQLVADTAYRRQDLPEFTWRPWSQRPDHYAATVSWIYAYGLAARMEYEARHGRLDGAREWGRYALAFDPGFKVVDLGPMPWEGRELAAQSLEFFAGLRRLDLAERTAAL